MHLRASRRPARLVALALVGVVAACSSGDGPSADSTRVGESAPSDSSPGGGDTGFTLTSSDDIPAVIESWGFDLQMYDPATGMAGVMKIGGVSPPPFDPYSVMDNRHLFMDYGVPGGSDTDLQMTFFLPLGTPVLAMVTGVVCDVPQLYSGDYSVRVAPAGVECSGPGAAVLFETEHVLNPLVAVGDSVVAGQQVATVSDYQRAWQPLGFGVVEIGAFFSKDNLPWHACPARFLHPEHAEQLTAVLASAHAAWEAEMGDTTLYDEAAQSPLGCTTTEDVQG